MFELVVKGQRGFSLVEALVAVAILAFSGLVSSNFLLEMVKSKRSVESKIFLQDVLVEASDLITDSRSCKATFGSVTNLVSSQPIPSIKFQPRDGMALPIVRFESGKTYENGLVKLVSMRIDGWTAVGTSKTSQNYQRGTLNLEMTFQTRVGSRTKTEVREIPFGAVVNGAGAVQACETDHNLRRFSSCALMEGDLVSEECKDMKLKDVTVKGLVSAKSLTDIKDLTAKSVSASNVHVTESVSVKAVGVQGAASSTVLEATEAVTAGNKIEIETGLTVNAKPVTFTRIECPANHYLSHYDPLSFSASTHCKAEPPNGGGGGAK